MELPPLIPALLVARRKRFLADVVFPDGAHEPAVAHLPNPGRMTACLRDAGPTPCWVSQAPPGQRRLGWTVELTQPGEALVLVNPVRANRVVGEALSRLFPGYTALAEQRLGAHRFDFRLTAPGEPTRWLEIKAASLVRDGVAAFPDAVSTRATAHLQALAACVAAGERATLLVLVARGDAEVFTPADDVDPQWGVALRRAVASGVTLAVWRAAVSRERVVLDAPLPVRL